MMKVKKMYIFDLFSTLVAIWIINFKKVCKAASVDNDEKLLLTGVKFRLVCINCGLCYSQHFQFVTFAPV